MNIERFFILIDAILDFVTLGWWSCWQGNKRIALHRERNNQ